MLTQDYNKWGSSIESNLRDVEGELIKAFPDDNNIIKCLGNEKLVFFGNKVAATIYGLTPESTMFDLVVIVNDEEPQEHEMVTVPEIISLLKQYQNSGGEYDVNQQDVAEVMNNLKEDVSNRDRLLSRQRLMGLAGIIKTPTVIHEEKKNLREYLPPVSWQKQHSNLLKGIQKASKDRVSFIKSAWNAYDKTTELSEVGGETDIVNADNPLVNDNNFHGRGAQEAGAIQSFDGSDYNKLSDSELDELYETSTKKGKTDPTDWSDYVKRYADRYPQDLPPENKKSFVKGFIDRLHNEKKIDWDTRNDLIKKHSMDEATITGDPLDPRNKKFMKPGCRWTARVYTEEDESVEPEPIVKENNEPILGKPNWGLLKG